LPFYDKSQDQTNMSNVIRFLETVGRKPLSAAEYAASVGALGASPPEREALTARDQNALAELLGGRRVMYCMILADGDLS
jgi:hypothetical protein